MKWFKGFMDLISGNSIVDKVMEYFPPSMTPQEKAELTIKIKDAEAARDNRLRELVNEATQLFNDRIKDMEGTAADLKSIPVVGTIIIFLRGCQRPVWGFAALWFDYQWLFAESKLNEFGVKINPFSEKQEMALIVINLLVLGFLFGERAVKNLMPLIMKFMEAKRA